MRNERKKEGHMQEWVKTSSSDLHVYTTMTNEMEIDDRSVYEKHATEWRLGSRPLSARIMTRISWDRQQGPAESEYA